jgi:hypothetical protein
MYTVLRAGLDGAVAAVLKAAETSRHHAALALRWERVHLDSSTLKPRSAGSMTGDIYGHTSDDTARGGSLPQVKACFCGRAGRMGLGRTGVEISCLAMTLEPARPAEPVSRRPPPIRRVRT